MPTTIQGKIGQRFLLTMLENDSIGEIELIEPVQTENGFTFYEKWWDGELCGSDHSIEAERIIENTPANRARAGKQTFAAYEKGAK